MEFGLLAVIGLAAIALMLPGLLRPGEAWDREQGAGLLSRLRKRKDRLLRAIKDIELEHESGKLSDDEFRRLRNDYKLLAIRAMKELDRVRSSRVRHLGRGRRGIPPSVRNRLEKVVERKRHELRQRSGQKASDKGKVAS